MPQCIVFRFVPIVQWSVQAWTEWQLHCPTGIVVSKSQISFYCCHLIPMKKTSLKADIISFIRINENRYLLFPFPKCQCFIPFKDLSLLLKYILVTDSLLQTILKQFWYLINIFDLFVPLNHTQFIICCIHSFHTCWMSDVYQVWVVDQACRPRVMIQPLTSGAPGSTASQSFPCPLSFPPCPPSPFRISLSSKAFTLKIIIKPVYLHSVFSILVEIANFYAN